MVDEALVFRAELEGLRLLANLPRPKVTIRAEDVPGASCLWETNAKGGHRDVVRLIPHSGVPLKETLAAIQRSARRVPGGHLEIRGIAASFDPVAVSLLRSLGGRQDTELPHTMMALDLSSLDDTTDDLRGLTATVATDAESLAQLRAVVGQVFEGVDEEEASKADNEADFYHAPGTMTYLAVSENGRVVSTGSFLIVDGVANIWSVATLPAARGRGAASAVVRAACVEARRQGARVAALRTTDELAKPGGLYQSIGFVVVGHEQAWNLDGIDALSI